MMIRNLLAVLTAVMVLSTCASAAEHKYDFQPVVSIDLGINPRQIKAVPVSMGSNREAILLVYCEDAPVDPYRKMFFFPKNTQKMLLFDSDGKILWRKEMNRGVIPGTWFCPVMPFDLDGDGTDEIWFVDNSDPDHPLSIDDYKLARLDAATGEPTGSWDWPVPDMFQPPSHLFRNFIIGGHVNGEPVLVTAQGTYGPMNLQGWNSDMSRRWEYKIARDTPGARGSHMCPVVDIDGDGADEFFWGERLIEFDTGKQVFCADEHQWNDHSDVVQPVLDRETGNWLLYTCREKLQQSPPRVVTFDSKGKRIWSDIEQGHMDMGWVARIGEAGRKVAMAIRIGHKTAGPKGFSRSGVEEFAWDVLTGKRIELPYSVYQSVPVDIDGDAIHELARSGKGGCEIIDRSGAVIARLDGGAVIAGKLFGMPGEQIVCKGPGGKVQVWADLNAKDNAEAKFRYNHSFYRANRKLTATGSNKNNLGGL